MRRPVIPYVERLAILAALVLAAVALVIANILGGWWYSRFWVWMAPVLLVYWVTWRVWANKKISDDDERPSHGR